MLIGSTCSWPFLIACDAFALNTATFLKAAFNRQTHTLTRTNTYKHTHIYTATATTHNTHIYTSLLTHPDRGSTRRKTEYTRAPEHTHTHTHTHTHMFQPICV